MSGQRTCVAKRIQELEPGVSNHILNVTASGMLKQGAVFMRCRHVSHEDIKLVKYSPQKEDIFRRIKENIGLPGDSGRIGVRTMCHTMQMDDKGRPWVASPATARYVDRHRMTPNTSIGSDTVMKVRIRGISSQMNRFRYLYGIILGELLLKHANNLS